MACSETLTTLRYLRGELSERSASRCAEHLHACTECRATMRFGAQTMLAARDEAETFEGPVTHESLRSAPPRAASGIRGLFVGRSATSGAPAKPRWILMAGCAAVIMWLVLRKSDAPSTAPVTERDPQQVALAAGLPFMESPSGLLSGRPRAISALLPAGASGFRVLLLDDEGQVLWSAQHRAGDPGVLAVDELNGQRVLAPFPTAEQVPLDTGKAYGLCVVIPGARMSTSTRFTLDPAAPR
ncbi:MAG: zf-HC2 domain-containing protein [Planctomycetes bacterium]|nr:zf-HC2 domain-containing protein [Planctomycetota bacterium]